MPSATKACVRLWNVTIAFFTHNRIYRLGTVRCEWLVFISSWDKKCLTGVGTIEKGLLSPVPCQNGPGEISYLAPCKTSKHSLGFEQIPVCEWFLLQEFLVTCGEEMSWRPEENLLCLCGSKNFELRFASKVLCLGLGGIGNDRKHSRLSIATWRPQNVIQISEALHWMKMYWNRPRDWLPVKLSGRILPQLWMNSTAMVLQSCFTTSVLINLHPLYTGNCFKSFLSVYLKWLLHR